jgi:Homeobox KN domain
MDSNENDQRVSNSQAMLLPTKVSEHHSVDDTVAYATFPKGLTSRWTSQPVMQWIESIAAATEASDQRGYLTIGDDILLSEPSSIVSGLLVDPKRSSTPPLLAENAETSCHWDLSYIDYNDPSAWMYTRQIKSLAGHLVKVIDTAKTTSSMVDMSEAYQMVQTRLNFTFDRIVWQNQSQRHPSEMPLDVYRATNSMDNIGNSEMRVLLDNLYEETIQKLKTMIADCEHVPHMYCQDQVTTDVQRNNIIAYHPPKQIVKQTNRHQNKQELGKYMTSWLRANFTNPYPDDEGLILMANHCGTTNQVISNWLINARTRKWRPAIIKATELGRPSDMLLEDSINIFDGKPIRGLVKNPSPTPTRSSNSTQGNRSQRQQQNNDFVMKNETNDDCLIATNDDLLFKNLTCDDENENDFGNHPFCPPHKRSRTYYK